jgi:hypothetical protein
MDRQPVEHHPYKWRGEYDDHYIEHNKPPIPVRVRVDGGPRLLMGAGPPSFSKLSRGSVMNWRKGRPPVDVSLERRNHSGGVWLPST